MTTLALTYTRIQKKVQTGISSVGLPVINWKAVCCAGFFTCLALLVFYVWQINDLTRGSYTINSYEKQNINKAKNQLLPIKFTDIFEGGRKL